MDKAEDIKSVKRLYDGEDCLIAIVNDGGGHVFRIYDALLLFEIPLYGGDGAFHSAFTIHQAEELVNLAYTWS